MNLFKPSRSIFGVLAVALALIQHTLEVGRFLATEGPWQPLWYVVNSAEVLVLVTASAMLWKSQPIVSRIIGVIGVALIGAIGAHNLGENLSDNFWLWMSTTVIFGLILTAIFTARRPPSA